MILAIDVGNSDVVIGGYENDVLRFTSRCACDRHKTADEYALVFKGILELHGVVPDQIQGGMISAVVPSLRSVIQEAIEMLTSSSFLCVFSGIKTGLNIRTENPGELGSDLVVGAVAAIAKYPKPIIIFDLGTATSISVIDQKGAYLGGMLYPGLRISVDALASCADQLPAITLKDPDRLIGKNTEECMRSGAIYGYAAMIDGLIDRLEAELGMPATSVITGGLGHYVAPFCHKQILVNQNLLLDGLCILHKKNRSRR